MKNLVFGIFIGIIAVASLLVLFGLYLGQQMEQPITVSCWDQGVMVTDNQVSVMPWSLPGGGCAYIATNGREYHCQQCVLFGWRGEGTREK